MPHAGGTARALAASMPDLLGSDDIVLTQEFLAEMLGARRTSVSLVASALKQAA